MLRFWNNELIDNEEAVLAQILKALVSQLPSPGPLPERERVKNEPEHQFRYIKPHQTVPSPHGERVRVRAALNYNATSLSSEGAK